jgi:hypothetical protein
MAGFETTNKKVGAPQRYLENALVVVDGIISDEARVAFEERVEANLYGRTGLIFDVREYRFDAPRAPRPPETVKIACVSSAINVTGTTSTQPGDLELKKFRDGCALLERTGELKPGDWEELRIGELRKTPTSFASANLPIPRHLRCRTRAGVWRASTAPGVVVRDSKGPC